MRSIFVNKLSVFGMAFATIATTSIFGDSPASAFSPLSSSSSDFLLGSSNKTDKLRPNEKILAVGNDNKTRSIETTNNGLSNHTELKNRINLQPGDNLVISENGEVANLYDKSGNNLGKFVAPTMVIGDKEFPGKFSYDGEHLITSPSASENEFIEHSCGKATAAKWTWRVAGTLTCGALGFATVVGGGICGLAWAGAEDAMNIDQRACR